MLTTVEIQAEVKNTPRVKAQIVANFESIDAVVKLLGIIFLFVAMEVLIHTP